MQEREAARVLKENNQAVGNSRPAVFPNKHSLTMKVHFLLLFNGGSIFLLFFLKAALRRTLFKIFNQKNSKEVND